MTGRLGRLIYGLVSGAALIFGSLAITLIGLEVSLRIWDGLPVIPAVNFVDLEINTVVNPNNPMARYDDRLGWAQVAYARGGGGDVRYTFGEDGIRMSSSQVVPAQPGAILVVGDSFGGGSGVGDSDTWPARLEDLVGTPVLNAAVGGYGIDQSVLRAEDLLQRFKLKMLIVETNLAFGISLNQLSVYTGAPKPYFMPEDGKLTLRNVPVPRGVSRGADIGWGRSILGYSYLVQYTMIRLNLLQWWVSPALSTKFASSNAQGVEVSCLLMRRLGELRNQSGIPVALVFQHGALDGLAATLGWEANRASVTRCAAQEHLPVIDIHAALRKVFEEGGAAAYQQLWVMHDAGRSYGHMSARGNELVANIVFRQFFSPELSEANPQREIQ
jgi:hypothetical protein